MSSVNNVQLYFENKTVKKPYNYFGSRVGQNLHTKLRLKCGKLNDHLYRKNLIPSPNCTCGLIETTYHYLLQCLRYNAVRMRYIMSVQIHVTVTADILLYGSENLSLEQNENFFDSVQNLLSI